MLACAVNGNANTHMFVYIYIYICTYINISVKRQCLNTPASTSITVWCVYVCMYLNAKRRIWSWRDGLGARVCVYVCIYVCGGVCIRMHVSNNNCLIHEYINTWTHALELINRCYKHRHINTCKYVEQRTVEMRKCANYSDYVCAYVCIYMCVYAHARMHAHIDSYMRHMWVKHKIHNIWVIHNINT